MSESTPLPSPATASLPAPGRRRRWLRIVLSAVIFVSGAVVGTGATLLVIRHQLLYALYHPDEMPTRVAARLRRALRLSEEQAEQIQTILVQRQQSLQTIRRRVQPEVEAELDQIEQQISAVLNEPQRQSWQQQFAGLRGTWLPPVPAE